MCSSAAAAWTCVGRQYQHVRQQHDKRMHGKVCGHLLQVGVAVDWKCDMVIALQCDAL
jgi:hypothetical protein